MSADFLKAFEARAADLPGAGLAPLEALRREAAAEFAARGYPTRRDEQWRQTDVSALAEISFAPAPAQISFTAPTGARVEPLAEALRREPERILAQLGHIAEPKASPFTALCTALFDAGLLIEIPAGAALDAPIEIRVEAPETSVPVGLHSRLLVLAGAGSRATLVERYAGRGVYLQNVVSELALGERAQLDHVRIQSDAPDAFHVASLAVHQEQDSTLRSHSIALGGRLARVDVATRLQAEGAEAWLHGLYLGRGAQVTDHHTCVDHAAPHTTSRELYKGILAGRAKGIFQGRVHVRPDAQRIDAVQTNRNLLLSDDASVHTKPQLEIHADDVRCAHGASIGRLDAEAMFYLRSRGIAADAARALLTLAFASEVIDALPTAPLRGELRAAAEVWLSELAGGLEA